MKRGDEDARRPRFSFERGALQEAESFMQRRLGASALLSDSPRNLDNVCKPTCC